MTRDETIADLERRLAELAEFPEAAAAAIAHLTARLALLRAGREDDRR